MIGAAKLLMRESADDVAVGTIIMWHGLLANIPTGWALCDGTNGTPDLRGRYLKGTAASTNPGSTGGANTHTHASHASQSHTGTAVTDHPALVHSGAAVGNHTQGTNASTSTPTISLLSSNTHSVTQAAQHAIRTHTVTQPTAHGAESHNTPNHEPAYYTVAFLRKT